MATPSYFARCSPQPPSTLSAPTPCACWRRRRASRLLEAGSGGAGAADRYSDLDLVLIARDEAYDDLLAERVGLARRPGALLAAFTGEHVGEPRLLICLYRVGEGDGLLHVDLKVVRRADLAQRVDDPRVLFDREGACEPLMLRSPAVWPERSAQWFEDRIWVWLHYGAARAGRGEDFEALDMLAFVRSQVLGPMLATAAGRPQRGLRHIEKVEGAAAALAPTLAQPHRDSLRKALHATLELYLDLRKKDPPPFPIAQAEDVMRRYIEMVLAP